MKTTLLVCTIALIGSSCSNRIDLTNYYDAGASFELIDMERPEDGNSSPEILRNEKRHDGLLLWLESNKKNWKPAHNTHAGLVIISQEKFRLLLYRNNDFAVVIITDDENVSRYYKKSLDTGGLEFLDK